MRAVTWLLLALACGLTLGTRASAQSLIAVQGALTRQHDLDVGQEAAGSIVLVNAGDASAQVRVAPADYTFDAAGQVRFGPPGQQVRSNAGWLRLGGDLDGDLLRVPAHGTATLTYRLRVPTPAPSGTSWSVILFKPLADPAAAGPAAGSAAPQDGLHQSLRYAVQIVTNVGAGGRPALVFTHPAVQPEGTALHVQLDLENHGERLTRPGLHASLCQPGGACRPAADSPPARLYPGTATRHTLLFDMAGAAGGPYELLVVADDGASDLFAVRYRLAWP